jgi:hypothetical protein
VPVLVTASFPNSLVGEMAGDSVASP